MFRSDIISLREFYSGSLGKVASRLMRDAVRNIWPELGNDTLIGIGYTQPLLPIWKQSQRQEQHISTDCFSFMPSTLGAIYWPTRGKNKSAMMDVTQLPLRDQQCNRIILLHTLEHAEAVSSELEECWRVLVPGGRMLVCVPNRLGIWARRENTPFASGRPYSMNELKHLLSEHHFTFKSGQTLLHTPPSNKRWILKIMPWLEQALGYLFPLFGGVLIVEVEKQIYASLPQKSSVLKPVGALMPKPQSVAQKINQD